MAQYATRNEHQTLATRVDVLESEVDGEKMVTRHILEQTRRNGDDLAAVKTRLDRHDRRFDGLEAKLDGLIKNLPATIAEVMREVLREEDRTR